MKSVTATEAKNQFGKLLDDAQVEPIAIEKNGRRIALVLTEQQLNRMIELGRSDTLVERFHEESIEKYSALYEALAK